MPANKLILGPPPGQLLDQAHLAGYDLPLVEAFHHALPRGFTHAAGPFRRIEEQGDRLTQPLVITGRDEQTGDSLLHLFQSKGRCFCLQRLIV